MMIKIYGNYVVNFDQLEYASPLVVNSPGDGIKLRFISGHYLFLFEDDMKAFLKDAWKVAIKPKVM